MTMDIAYVYYTDFDPEQAHANQIVHTCNALVDKGHEVTVLTSGDPAAYADAHDLSIRFDVRRIFRSVGSDTVDRMIYYLAALVAARGSDVLFTRDISFLRVVRRLPAAFRPPIVYEAHKAYSYLGGLTEAQERTRLATVDAIVAISEGVATDLTELGLDVAAVVPDAATTEQVPARSRSALREELGIDGDSELIVYSGSLSTWKNDLELLLEGFASVADDRPLASLLVVGGGDELDSLRKYANDIGIPDDRVEFTGHVPQTKVFEYLGTADVGVVPLTDRDRIASRYTSPLKLYEYLVSGLRVVASDVPSIASATADVDAVTRYEPGNREDLSRGLLEALDAPEPTHDRAAFSYGERAARLETVLESAVSKS